VLTAYLNNIQNDNRLKICPIHVRGKGGSKEKKRKEKRNKSERERQMCVRERTR